jgi:hypothetical protein
MSKQMIVLRQDACKEDTEQQNSRFIVLIHAQQLLTQT